MTLDCRLRGNDEGGGNRSFLDIRPFWSFPRKREPARAAGGGTPSGRSRQAGPPFAARPQRLFRRRELLCLELLRVFEFRPAR